jgi:hypothetical protein
MMCWTFKRIIFKQNFKAKFIAPSSSCEVASNEQLKFSRSRLHDLNRLTRSDQSTFSLVLIPTLQPSHEATGNIGARSFVNLFSNVTRSSLA